MTVAKSVATNRWVTFFHALAFVTGFSVVFVILGASVAFVGYSINQLLPTFVKVGGVVVIIFGLQVTGLFGWIADMLRSSSVARSFPAQVYLAVEDGLARLMYTEGRFQVQTDRSLGYLSSALMGVFFSAGWIPCVGPVLAAIYLLASDTGTVGQGALLLLFYAAGLGIPFLLTGRGLQHGQHLAAPPEPAPGHRLQDYRGVPDRAGDIALQPTHDVDLELDCGTFRHGIGRLQHRGRCQLVGRNHTDRLCGGVALVPFAMRVATDSRLHRLSQRYGSQRQREDARGLTGACWDGARGAVRGDAARCSKPPGEQGGSILIEANVAVTEKKTDVVVNLPATGPTGQLAAAVDRMVRSLARHWLAVFNTFVAIFVALPFLAPVFMHVGATGLGRLIYTVYSPTCHQLPERSYFLFGPKIVYSVQDLETAGAIPAGLNLFQREWLRFPGNAQIGYKVAFCERDVAIYASILLAGLVFGLLRGRSWATRKRIPKLPMWGYALFLVPMAIDGFTQLFGWRESNWYLRLITGLLFGVASVWLAYPYVQEAMDDVLLAKPLGEREATAG